MAKFSSFSAELLREWTKDLWTSLKMYVNLTRSGLNLWSAKNDLRACLLISSLGSPLLVDMRMTQSLFLLLEDSAGHNWSNTSWDESLGSWRNWWASRTSNNDSNASSCNMNKLKRIVAQSDHVLVLNWNVYGRLPIDGAIRLYQNIQWTFSNLYLYVASQLCIIIWF